MPFALDALPPVPTANVSVRVAPRAERHLRKKHPWLFDQAITHESRRGAPGDLAVVFDKKRKLLGLGLYDPTSPIRVKMLHFGRSTSIDEAFFRQRLREAFARREILLSTGTDGYRVVHGENDGLPGLVVDRYAGTWVLKLYTPAWIPRLRQVLPPLFDLAQAERWVLRLSRRTAGDNEHRAGLVDGEVIKGPPLEGPVVFRENHLRFEADPLHGQKTGFFLDQRDNRARVGALARGQKVLNVFSYNGGFSLYAARGGAREVVSLDLSQPALDASERIFALNQDAPAVAACAHRVLCGDAFEVMADLKRRGERYGVVVIDPPSFAKKQDEVEGALRAYARLVGLGLELLAPDGDLVLASCSSRVSLEDFRANAQKAAAHTGRRLKILEQSTHALDHPIGFPEGAYLKCLFCRSPG